MGGGKSKNAQGAQGQSQGISAIWNGVPCCQPGDMVKKRGLGPDGFPLSSDTFMTGKGGSQYPGGSKAGAPGTTDSHSMLRSSPMTQLGGGPKLYEFILVPWACAVVILLFVLLSEGCNKWLVTLPFVILFGITISYGYKKYKQKRQPEVGIAALCAISCLAAFIIGLITYVNFLGNYCHMKGGASYFNVLPSETPLGHADMTGMMFAEGTAVDQSRTYGFVDGSTPWGHMYCVAPMSNKYTAQEAGVAYFAAGLNCCNARSNFQCGQAAQGYRGALMISTESEAAEGYRKAVEGAQYAYGLTPTSGYLLLHVVKDPVSIFTDYWRHAVKLVLVYIGVYLIISCMVGYMAQKAFTK